LEVDGMSEDKTVQVLDSIDFHGHGLTVVVRGGEPYVAMRSIVEGMGLTWPSQYQKMMDNKERWGVVMIVTPSQGGEQATVCMPLRKLTGWLMTLQPSRMEAAIAQRVLLYQHECDDALWAYWTKGMAVNPRVVRPNDSTLLGLPDFQDPVAAAEAWIEQYKRHKVAEAEVKLLVAKVQEDAPKVAFYEDF
jgi:hypothetical protein